MKQVVALVVLIAVATTAQAQEAYIELLRQDVRAQKVAIITEVMQFSDEQADAFWPLHREYEVELAALSDARIALIKDYALNFESMTGEKADQIVKEAFTINEKRLKLRERYYNKFKRALDPIMAAKWVQLENQIQNLIDLQVGSELPLIQEATVSKAGKSGESKKGEEKAGGW